MKKTFFMGVMGMFLLGSCSSHSGHNHEGHDHEGHNHATEEHAHNHEGHSHEHDHEGHNHEAHEHNHDGHNHEGHNHDAHEGHNHAEEAHKHEAKAEAHNHDAHAHEGHDHDHGHAHGVNPDEIILAPHKAKAAGVASMEIQPKAFRQVIKASGEVQAAQGNESTIVANVSGIVSFQRSVTEGMQVGKGATIMTISARNLQDGDPAERARIAYEAAKADFDRASRLVESQIVSQKEFNAI